MSDNVIKFTDLKAPTDPGEYHRLLCMTGSNKGTSYIINVARIVAGRGAKADISIEDSKASREHFEIVKIRDRYVLTDMKSQNGTLVNDLKVTQHKLSDGDTIIVGKTIYKYSVLTVLDSDKNLAVHEDGELEEAQETETKEEKEEKSNKFKDKKRLILYGIVVILVLIVVLAPTDDKKVKVKTSRRDAVIEEDEKLVRTLSRDEQVKQNKLEEVVAVYLHRGLRELREKNYYRALHEFEQALVKAPKHNRAEFYISKTKKALDEEIERMFEKAARDIESLKLMRAVKTYCAIIRLIDRWPDDERYIAAQQNIRTLEDQMGLEKDEIKCY